MKLRFFVALVGAVSVAACFSAVPEQPCTNDAGCLNADGGLGGGSDGGSAGGGTGGGSAGGTGGGAAGGSGGGSAGGVGGGSAGGAGGSGGGAAGGAGGGGPSDAGICGCTTALLGCQIGDSPASCGGDGGTCALCNLGSQCVSGSCVVGSCSPATCTGCCTNNFCFTFAQQNRFGCGTAGVACAMCPGANQSCLNGVCGTAVCDATSCPTGCCFQNQCVTIQSRFNCGTAGAACQQCAMGSTCNAGVCGPSVNDAGIGPGTDGGGVTVGSPCANPQACRPPQAAICIQESQFGQPSGYPGGYCTAQCGATTACVNSDCITETVFGVAQSSCRASCPSPGGGQSTCRTGYVCVGSASSVGGYCRPNCANGGLAACGGGQVCGATGYCN